MPKLIEVQFILGFFILISGPLVLAADTRPAFDFFRSPESKFRSGQASTLDLIRNQTGSESRSVFEVEKDGRIEHLREENLIRDIHVAWKLENGNPVLSDPGAVVLLVSSALRAQPSWKSPIVDQMPAGERAQVLRFEGDWIEVECEGKRGFVDESVVLTKSDFAAYVFYDGLWRVPSHREGDVLVLKDGTKAQISKIQGWKTRPELGIIGKVPENTKLLLRHHVKIVRTEFQTWNISKLPGHGEVYWRMQQAPTEELSTEALHQRDLYSVSFNPGNPRQGLASGKGVYFTNDGQTWRKLPQFGAADLPVLIDTKGRWYVGSTRSLDQGKSFSELLDWTRLAQFLEKTQRAPAPIMKLVDLQIEKPQILRVSVDTGLRKLQLLSKIDNDVITHFDLK